MKLSTFAALAAASVLAVPGLALADSGRAENWDIGMRAAASPVQQQMIDFHNLLLIIISGIVLLVLVLLGLVIVKFRASKNPTPSRTTHNTLLEVGWTALPLIILAFIAWDSMRLLYFMDRVEEPEMTLLVTGYQWYWGYAYPDQQIDEFSSFLIPEEELQEGQLRLLSVDNPVILPVDTDIEIIVTAGDVLHSWAMPSFGIKTDAVPLRQNHTWVRIEREGTYYGLCSEICGNGHAYMPIEVRAVSRADFDDWVEQQVAGRELKEPPVLLTRTYQPPADSEAAEEEQHAQNIGQPETLENR